MGNSLPFKRISGIWKHLIICPDRAVFQGLTSILAELTPGSVLTDLKAYPTRRALSDVLGSAQPNLCFLDVGSSWESAVALMNEVNSISPPIPVVAISSGNDPDIILRSLRQGASEFLFQPFAVEQVGAALDRLTRLHNESGQARGEMGKVFCVVPGQGASGASTLAANVSFRMQKLNPQKKVLLADLDPNSGTLSFLLKLKSSYSFIDVLQHSSQMDEDLWKAIVNNWHGVDVILSPENPVDSIPIHEAGHMIDYSREHYGNVILDMAGVHGDWTEQIAKLCDELLLVTTNELPALHSTQKAVAHLERGGVEHSKIRLIVNRYDPENGLELDAIETALNLEVSESLPNDVGALQKSLLEGKSVGSSTSLGKGYNRIAESLAGARKTEVKRKALFGGLFSAFEGVLK